MDLGVDLRQVLVLAVNRGGALLLPPEPLSTLEPGDVLVVAGPLGDVNLLEDLA